MGKGFVSEEQRKAVMANYRNRGMLRPRSDSSYFWPQSIRNAEPMSRAGNGIKCPYCKRIFTTEPDCKCHMVSTHSRVSTKYPIFSGRIEKIKNVKCIYCNKLFTTEFGCNHHIKDMHPEINPEIKKVKCLCCNGLFTTESDRDNHVRNLHPEIKKVKKEIPEIRNEYKAILPQLIRNEYKAILQQLKIVEMEYGQTVKPKKAIIVALNTGIELLSKNDVIGFNKHRKEVSSNIAIPIHVYESFFDSIDIETQKEELKVLCMREGIQYEDRKLSFLKFWHKLNDKAAYVRNKQIERYENSKKIVINLLLLGIECKYKSTTQYLGEDEIKETPIKVFYNADIGNEHLKGLFNSKWYISNESDFIFLNPVVETLSTKEGAKYIQTTYSLKYTKGYTDANLSIIDFKPIIQYLECDDKTKSDLINYFDAKQKLVSERAKLKKAYDIANDETEIEMLENKLILVTGSMMRLRENYKYLSDKIKSISSEEKTENDLSKNLLALHRALLNKRITKNKGYILTKNQNDNWIKEYNLNAKIQALIEKIVGNECKMIIEFFT